MRIKNVSTRKLTTSLVLVMLLCGLAPSAVAEDDDDPELVESTVGAKPEQQDQAAALAKTVQNPIASLVSLPLQYNMNSNVGQFERLQATLNIQPVVPFELGDKATLVTRTIIPVTSVPIGEQGSEFGFGDIMWSGFYTPKSKGKLTYGVGAQVNLPTASNDEILGSGSISLGPSGVLFYGTGKWTLGAVASNVWDIADATGRRTEGDDVNFFFAQWFVNYNFGKGLALGTAPIVTCDWEYETSGSDDDRCTFPLGLQVSKVTFAGTQPLNILIGFYKNIASPTNGADGQVRIQVNFMFPSKRKS